MRRWIYAQGVASDAAPERFSPTLVRDRVRGYLLASRALFDADTQPQAATQAAPRTKKRA
jgi:hypothetical protein